MSRKRLPTFEIISRFQKWVETTNGSVCVMKQTNFAAINTRLINTQDRRVTGTLSFVFYQIITVCLTAIRRFVYIYSSSSFANRGFFSQLGEELFPRTHSSRLSVCWLDLRTKARRRITNNKRILTRFHAKIRLHTS